MLTANRRAQDADRASMYAAIAERLPSLPAVALEVVRLSKQDWVELNQLAEVLGRDPALCAKVLKLANSPLYGRRRQVSTVGEAVLTLGLNTVKMAALSFSVSAAAGADEDLGGYQLRDFWRRSLVQSIVGRGFAAALGTTFADEAFTLGLLMDLSVPVLARAAGERYLPVVIAMDAGHPSTRLEEEHLGGTHAGLSGKLMDEWGLPPAMVTAATYHHQPDALPPDIAPAARDLIRVMNLAHLSASVMVSPDKGEPLRDLNHLAARWFGQDEAAVERILHSLSPTVDELAEIVNVDIGGELKAAEILDLARQQLVEVSMTAVTDLRTAEKRVDELEKKAATDALTGLNNRATFDSTLEREWQRRVGEEFPDTLGLIMLDIDHFKRFNDTFGHQAGDDVLRGVAAALKSAVRDTDIVCRYGGEEFAVVAPYAAGSSLRALAERVRRSIERSEISVVGGGPQKVTASLGVAALTTEPGERRPEDLISLADKALYEAKRNGRNRVEAAADI
jgi:diguanylate cyclase (GGDEF)-like protein